MWKILLVMLSLPLVILRLGRWHITVPHEKGSPDPAQPLKVENPHVAQAYYGRLTEEKAADYFVFEAEANFEPRCFLLIPANHYDNGLRATFELHGDGFDMTTPKESEGRMTIAGTDYIMTRSYVPALPTSGNYTVAVRRLEGAGTYCMCIGSGEGDFTPAPDARARVAELLKL
jgi:hypothetical protein